MSYEVSDAARKDLIEIWEFTLHKWSAHQADTYYKILIEKIKLISLDPNIGKSYSNIRDEYRGASVKSHIIFYRFKKSSVIEIMRILHERMDIENRLIK